MPQWQSLCLALIVSITSASAASAQSPTGGVTVQSGDVWLLPGDRVSSVIVPQGSPSNAYLPTGDVWISPDHQTIPSVAERIHPVDATLATRRSE
jgi:hypothetical protein